MYCPSDSQVAQVLEIVSVGKCDLLITHVNLHRLDDLLVLIESGHRLMVRITKAVHDEVPIIRFITEIAAIRKETVILRCCRRFCWDCQSRMVARTPLCI